MDQAAAVLLAPSQLTRTRNVRRDSKCLADGPIDADVLKKAHKEACMRRALAALPRDPNEPPRKRGRPRKERRLAADEQQPSPCSTKSSMSANKDINIQELHLWQNRGRSRSSSTEEKERASNSGAVRTSHSPTPTSSPRSSSEYAQDIHGGVISYSDIFNTIDTPVNLNSPVKDVAALLLAVAEQARLEGPEEAQCPRSSKDSTKASNITKTKGRKGRSRRRRC